MKFFYFVNDFNFFINNFRFLVNSVNSNFNNIVYFSKNIKADTIRIKIKNTQFKNLLFDKNHISFSGLFFTLYQLFILILKNPSAVFTPITIIPIILSGFFLRLLKRKCVFVFTGLGSVFINNSFKYRCLRHFVVFCLRIFLQNKNAFILVQNHDDKKLLAAKLKIDGSRIKIILGCGRLQDDFPFIENLPTYKYPRIYIPARLIKDKGIEDIAAASRILTERGIKHEFLFTSGITKGNPKAFTEFEIESLKKNYPSLKFLGFQKDVRDVYRQSSLVCLPSYREGLPGALIEASAMGIPMISTNTPGCREVVIHNQTGLLVEPNNPSQIADSIIMLTNNKELSDRLRLNAYDRFLKYFTTYNIIDQYIHFFDQFKVSDP